MTPAASFGFAAILIGIVMFASKMAVEGEPMDVMALCGLCIAAGYLGHGL